MIADTDVLTDFLSGSDPGFTHVRMELDRGALETTVITRYELMVGAVTARQQQRIEDLLAAIPALSLDTEAVDLAAGIRRQLDRRGVSIGMADSLIAGIVIAHGGVLLTRNRRHFERVEKLRIADL